MIIIKIIFIYFIEIAHTDDLLSTAARLVMYKSCRGYYLICFHNGL